MSKKQNGGFSSAAGERPMRLRAYVLVYPITRSSDHRITRWEAKDDDPNP